MAKRQLLKSVVTSDKLVIELSLKNLRAEVEAYNRLATKISREDPREPWPLYTVTNGKAFMKFLVPYLMEGRHPVKEKLPNIVAWAIHDILGKAAKRRVGVSELPRRR